MKNLLLVLPFTLILGACASGGGGLSGISSAPTIATTMPAKVAVPPPTIAPTPTAANDAVYDTIGVPSSNTSVSNAVKDLPDIASLHSEGWKGQGVTLSWFVADVAGIVDFLYPGKTKDIAPLGTNGFINAYGYSATSTNVPIYATQILRPSNGADASILVAGVKDTITAYAGKFANVSNASGATPNDQFKSLFTSVTSQTKNPITSASNCSTFCSNLAGLSAYVAGSVAIMLQKYPNASSDKAIVMIDNATTNGVFSANSLLAPKVLK